MKLRCWIFDIKPETKMTFNELTKWYSESVIMEITRHSTREIFDRYNTVDLEDRKQAVKVFEDFLHNQAINVDQNVDQVAISGK